jgi:hypothetical protein
MGNFRANRVEKLQGKRVKAKGKSGMSDYLFLV